MPARVPRPGWGRAGRSAGLVGAPTKRSWPTLVPAGLRDRIGHPIAEALGFLAWFLVDASLSVVHEAWFNVWMIDLPSLVAVALSWWLALRDR